MDKEPVLNIGRIGNIQEIIPHTGDLESNLIVDVPGKKCSVKI